MLHGHDERLTSEEAAEIARLHAERVAREEARAQAERERLAETTAPEELAAMIGASPEEVRELAHLLRSGRWGRARRVGLGSRQAWTVGSAVVALVAALLAAFFLLEGAREVGSPAPPGALSGGNLPAPIQVLPPNPPIWDPYAQNFTREPARGVPWRSERIAVLDPSVSAPPAGYEVSLAAPSGSFAVAGPPEPRTARDPRVVARELRGCLTSLVRSIEGKSEVKGSVPYLRFPTRVPRVDGATSVRWARYIGWHAVRVRGSRYETTVLLPDRRYVRPGDEEAYRREFESRLDWILDNKTIPGARSSMASSFRRVALRTRFPKGVALGAGWSGGGLVAEGDGDALHPGRDVVAALRELLERAYGERERGYGKRGAADEGLDAIAEFPGDAWDLPLSPHEWGHGPPPAGSSGGGGVGRLGLYEAAAAKAFAPRPRRRPVLTHLGGTEAQR